MTEYDLTRFAAFINQSVAVARQIIEQDDQEPDPDVHNGYNYRTQRWELDPR